ncbi:MAG: hypothetical protein ABL927_00190 [Bdellovibrionales bacterium]
MKSLQRSYGKIYRASLELTLMMFIASLLACANTSQRGDSSQVSNVEDSKEQSLVEDQKSIEELRKNIPAQKRVENDQLKEILSLMGEVKEPPAQIREKFDRVRRRMRDQFQRSGKLEREKFSRDSKKNRELFFAQLKDKRQKILDQKKAHKIDSEKAKDEFEEIEVLRKNFTSEDREKSDDFNTNLRQKSDDFNQDMRDRTNSFNQEYRVYTNRYNEHMKALKELKDHEKTPPAGYSAPLKTNSEGE